eukprot:1175735-Prorocentrum_minimum.AAC.6
MAKSIASEIKIGVLVLVLVTIVMVFQGSSKTQGQSERVYRAGHIRSHVVVPEWSQTSIGSDKLGSAEILANDTIKFASLGTDLWGRRDHALIAYSPLPDGRHQRVDVRVDSPVGIMRVHYHAKAALLIRESLDPGAAFVGVAVTGERGPGRSATVMLLHRAEKGGETVARAVDEFGPEGAHDNQTMLSRAMAAPGFPYLGLGKSNVWLRLERHGHLYRGYASTLPPGKRSHWTSLGPPVSMPILFSQRKEAVVGLAVTRGPRAKFYEKARTSFSNFRLRTIGSTATTAE